MNRLQKIIGDRDLVEILTGSGVAFLAKVAGSVLAIVLSIFLTRTFGAEAAGTYFLLVTIITFFAMISRIGLDNALVRYASTCQELSRPGSLSYLVRTGILLIIGLSTLATVVLYFGADWLSDVAFNKPELGVFLQTMAFAVLGTSVTIGCLHILKGTRRVLGSQLLEVILTPVLIVALLWFVWTQNRIEMAIQAHIVATIATAVLGLLMIARYAIPATTSEPDVTGKQLITTSLPLMGTQVVAFLMTSASALFLARFGELEDVAIYVAASRAAFVTSILLNSIATIAAPKFASFSARGDMKKLERAILQVNFGLTAISIVVLIVYLLFATQIMGLFGDGFRQGATILIILSIGQFVSVSSGTVGPLLMMCGHERATLNITIAVCIMNILLNLTLIPAYGTLGAAAATAATMIIRNLIGIVIAQRLIGISVFPLLNLLSRRRPA